MWSHGNPVKKSEIKWNQVKSSEFRWNQVKSSEIRWNQVKSGEIKWNQVKSSEIRWNHWNQVKSLKSSEITEIKWNQVKSSEIRWNQVKSSEIKRNQAKSQSGIQGYFGKYIRRKQAFFPAYRRSKPLYTYAGVRRRMEFYLSGANSGSHRRKLRVVSKK